MEWIAAIGANKFVTICLDRHWSPELAEKYLNQWFRRLHQKLFRKSPEESGSNYLEMHGCCEYDGDQNIHYHIAVRVPESHVMVFDTKARKAWESVLSKSRFHVKEHGDSLEDMFQAARYMTKSINYMEWWRPEARPSYASNTS